MRAMLGLCSHCVAQILVKFEDYSSLRQWEASDSRTAFISELDALATCEPEMEYVMGVPLIHSLFDVPSPFGGRLSTTRPPS